GTWLAGGNPDFTVKVWDPEREKEHDLIQSFKGHTSSVQSVCFIPAQKKDSRAIGPRGLRLASASLDGTVKVWDAHKEPDLITLPLTDSIRPLTSSTSWSLDGKRLAGAGQDGKVKVWDLEKLRHFPAPLLTIGGQRGPVHTVCWSPDGKRIAGGGQPEEVTVWDVSMSTKGQQAGGREVLPLVGQTSPGWGLLCYSPDGHRLAGAAGDPSRPLSGQVKVWDADTGREVLPLPGPLPAIMCVGFS